VSESEWAYPMNRGELIMRCEALAADLAERTRQRDVAGNEGMRLAAELAAEKMAHSVTIADEHESRTAFQERIRELVAALRDLVDYTDITKHVDADAVTARVKRAREVLGLATETKDCPVCGDTRPQHQAGCTSPLNQPRAASETPVEHACRCINICRKDGLRPSEHCREDQLTAQLAPETPAKQLPLCSACDDTGIYSEPQDSHHLDHKPVPCPFCYASKIKGNP
jgi:hypothetical protein